jgi:type 1 glutamine amidotransferase
MMKAFPLWLALHLALLVTTTSGADKRLVLIAGKPSHGPGDHEFRAGCLLLQQCLAGVKGLATEVHTNGWPASDRVLEGADAVFIYADGGGGHPAIQGERLQLLDALAAKGVGLGFGHYGVEVPKGAPGEAMWRWCGGYYEHEFSVNPMWTPEFTRFPDHPVCRGVKSFAVLDEWYFNMRWRPDATGLTHILVATPSDAVRDGPYVYPRGPYPHIQAAKGRAETMMWTYERPDGGRGFGFTGGHKHVNWYNDNFRKVVLNALLWIAKVEVPAGGVESTVAPEDLAKNLDPKGQPADAPNLTGRWGFKVQTPNGMGEPTFRFVHAGQNLLGYYRGYFGEAEISGSVDRGTVRFAVPVERDGQRERIDYTGKIDSANRLSGTVKFGDFGEGTWTAERQ